MATWKGAPDPVLPRLGWGAKIRAGVRVLCLVVVTFTLLPIYAVAKLVERAVPRLGVTRLMVKWWARTGLFACGLRLRVHGAPMQQAGAGVANHSSWADIFVTLSAADMFLVAKSDVRRWPVIGWLAAFTGTAFVERRREAAKAQEAMFLDRIHRGHRLGFFPEGTSSDGLQVLPFKSTLFAAFTAPAVREEMWVQPISIVYHAPDGFRPDFYGWWGEMGFGAHFATVAGMSKGGTAHIVFHEPVRAADFGDRKELARYCESAVAEGHAAHAIRVAIR